MRTSHVFAIAVVTFFIFMMISYARVDIHSLVFYGVMFLFNAMCMIYQIEREKRND